MSLGAGTQDQARIESVGALYVRIGVAVLAVTTAGCARGRSDLASRGPARTALQPAERALGPEPQFSAATNAPLHTSLPTKGAVGAARPTFLRDAANEASMLVTNPRELPLDVQSGLANAFHASTLEMAASQEPYSSGCLVEEGLPRRRLLFAAVGQQYAIVHFEQGGFAPMPLITVLGRTPNSERAQVLWTGLTCFGLSTPEAFRHAIRSGEAWRGEPESCSSTGA
jgi:hypothetical protein